MKGPSWGSKGDNDRGCSPWLCLGTRHCSICWNCYSPSPDASEGSTQTNCLCHVKKQVYGQDGFLGPKENEEV